MYKALALAKQGIGLTAPNPATGVVIVKGGVIVGEGWHKKAGQDHAEIVAIKEVMKKSNIVTVDLDPMLFRNAVLYTTLEPCCHNGKTPACVKAIAAAHFNKVCIGMKDPFKKVNGKGISYLKKYGIEVQLCKVGTKLANEIREINQPFIKWAETTLPYVVMKAAISLDGKIATAFGQSKWITSEEARQDARLNRSKYDAVIVGANTVKADDPQLAAFGKYKDKKILRVIIDGKLNLSIDRKIFRDKNVLVACSEMASVKNKLRFKKAGIEVKVFGKSAVDIKKLLHFLGKRGIQSVFVEGGSQIHGAFYDAALKDRSILDKVLFYIAPKLLGGKEAINVIAGKGVQKLSKALNLKKLEIEKVGEDLKVEGVINFY